MPVEDGGKHSNFAQKCLTALTIEHPNWHSFPCPPTTICVPSLFESVRKNLESDDGRVRKLDATGNCGDVNEQRIFDAYKRLPNSGAMLVANFGYEDFQHLAGAIWRAYRKEIRDRMDEKFQCDFLLFHANIGMFLIEAKSSHRFSAVVQVKRLAEQLKILFQIINGTECDIPPIHCAVFCPGGQRLKNELTNRNDNSGVVVVDMDEWKEESDNQAPEALKQFWTDFIETHSSGNNFYDSIAFRRFVGVACSYRKAIYLNGILNAIQVAKLVDRQQLFSKPSDKGKRSLSIDDDEAAGEIILTDEQQAAVECTDQKLVVSGSPGTGKTFVVTMQAVNAAKTDAAGKLWFLCFDDYRKKFWQLFNSAIGDDSCVPAAPRRNAIRLLNIGTLSNEYLFDAIADHDDVYADEVGPQTWRFFQRRATAATGRTVLTVTGNVSAADCAATKRIVDDLAAAHGYTNKAFTVVMRGTANVIDYWERKLLGIDGGVKVGHGIRGPPRQPVRLCRTVRETLQAVFDRVQQLLSNGARPRHIAIITDNVIAGAFEANTVRQYLIEKSNELLPFTSVKIHARHSLQREPDVDALTVVVFTEVMSFEWPFVIVCSLTCSENNDHFIPMAASRSLGEVTVIFRDYRTAQRQIDNALKKVEPTPSFLSIKGIVNEVLHNYNDEWNEDKKYEEAIRHIALVHYRISALRANISEEFLLNSDVFQSCQTVTDCLYITATNPDLMRRFVAEFYHRENGRRAVYEKISADLRRNMEITMKYPQRYIQRVLSVDPSSRTAEIYREFRDAFAAAATIFFNEQGFETLCEVNSDDERILKKLAMVAFPLVRECACLT